MAGPEPAQSKARGTDQRGTGDRGVGRRDAVLDTGLGPMTVAAVVRDTPPPPLHSQLARWVPDDVRNNIRVLEEAGQFERDALLKRPDGRFLQRYPNAQGTIVIWISIAQNVELHAYREFPEDFAVYLEQARGDQDTARLLHESYTQFNRDLYHLVSVVGLRPDFARGELRHINDQVLKLVLEMCGWLLNQGATLGAIQASSRKILEIKKPQVRGAPKEQRPSTPKPTGRQRIDVDEETLLKKALGDKDYAEHVEAVQRIRSTAKELDALTDAEIIAVRAYSHNSSDQINRALRHGGVTPEIKLVIDRLKSALGKLKAVEGELVRGIAMDQKNARKLFVEGKDFVDNAFQSCTTGQIPVDSTLVLTIKAIGKNGRDISKIAAHDEREVLFLPRTRFKVTKVTPDPSGDIRFIDLLEL